MTTQLPNPVLPALDPALQTVTMVTACLEHAKNTMRDMHQAIRDLQQIVTMQNERIDHQADAVKALQAMCRNLDERIKVLSQQQGGGFAE